MGKKKVSKNNIGTYKRKAFKYYRKKNYKRAIFNFEEALRRKKNDPQIYYYLGVLSILTGDLDGARRYFRSGLLKNEGNLDLMKGLSYIYIKDERIEDAIGLWGEILEKRPYDKRIKQVLKRLRLSEDVEKFIEELKPEDILYMKPPFFVKIKPYFVGLLILLILIIFGLIFYLSPLYDKALNKFFPMIVELKSVELPEEKNLIMPNADEAFYYFNDKELKNSFIKIKRYIYKGKINRAIVLLNKIMYSNALPQVKERFRLLYKFIETPDPLSLDYNPQFYEIVKDPIAYKGVYVLWSGRIANLIKGKDTVEFDLLVNYIDEDTIAGIAHVKLAGKYYIENKMKVQVFGKYEGYDKKTGKLFIDGILLKRLNI